jgi:hypothetical protein
MVFAEAEANAVTDELVRSSSREHEREPQKIELLEGDGEEPMPSSKTVIPTTSVNEEEEEMQFEISLSPETERSGEGEESGVELEDVTAGSTSNIVVDQPKEEPEKLTASVEPVTSTKVKSDDGLQTQPIPMDTTTNDSPADDKISIPEPTLIPEEIEEVRTKPDDNESISASIVKDDELATSAVPAVVEAPTSAELKLEATREPETKEPTNEGSEIPADDKLQPEVSADATDTTGVATKEDKEVEEKSSVTSIEVGEVVTGEEKR